MITNTQPTLFDAETRYSIRLSLAFPTNFYLTLTRY